MYIYETHLHTREASKCSHTYAELYPQYYKRLGYSGIFITDHFFNGSTCISSFHSWEKRIKLFCKGYENAKKAAEGMDFSVFFGVEYNFEGDEFLLYGIDKEWLIEHPEIMHQSRKGLYEIIDNAGGLMVQAHPFRERRYISTIHLSPVYCHAWEGYNSHNTDINNQNAVSYCNEHNIFMTAGSDLHKLNSIPEKEHFGMQFNSPLTCEKDYVNAIKSRHGQIYVADCRIVKPGQIITNTPVVVH